MGNYFPRWSNWMPLKIAVCLGFVVVGLVIGANYYLTPKYARVGYQPTQPVAFSHKMHVGQLGMDCRYCHSYIEVSPHANVPTNQTCYNCHGPDKGQVRKDSPALAQVRDANATGQPIQWTQVHKTPDYVYFDHRIHVNRGVSCVSCHGQVNEMEVVRHDQPHSMGWCLDCHREPEKSLRPLDQITNLVYKPEHLDRASFYSNLHAKGTPLDKIGQVLTAGEKPETPPGSLEQLVALAADKYGPKVTQEEVGLQLKEHWRIYPPQDCTACHR